MLFDPKKRPAPENNKSFGPTVLARDLKIEGEISSPGIIEIEGSVKGDIKAGTLVIRENGKVEGEVNADSVIVKGTFHGNMKINKHAEFSSSSKIVGVIDYHSLTVEDGACIDGQFKWSERSGTTKKS